MNTGAMLGWKFNNAPGITTVDGVITEWPESLGAIPTQEQIDAWMVKFDIQLQIDSIKNQLNSMEYDQRQSRGERESWRQLLVYFAGVQSVPEATLYAANPFYKRVKDTDVLATTLRAQIRALENQL